LSQKEELSLFQSALPARLPIQADTSIKSKQRLPRYSIIILRLSYSSDRDWRGKSSHLIISLSFSTNGFYFIWYSIFYFIFWFSSGILLFFISLSAFLTSFIIISGSSFELSLINLFFIIVGKSRLLFLLCLLLYNFL